MISTSIHKPHVIIFPFAYHCTLTQGAFQLPCGTSQVSIPSSEGPRKVSLSPKLWQDFYQAYVLMGSPPPPQAAQPICLQFSQPESSSLQKDEFHPPPQTAAHPGLTTPGHSLSKPRAESVQPQPQKLDSGTAHPFICSFLLQLRLMTIKPQT